MSKTKSVAYWLFKTEPDDFSVLDLQAANRRTTCWDGVRNYQARNFLRDEIHLGDRVLVYHSNANPAAIVGVASVVREGYPDHTAWDPKDAHFDPKSSPENPRWFMVDIQLQEVFARPLALAELREQPALNAMELLRKGSRLSGSPFAKRNFSRL